MGNLAFYGVKAKFKIAWIRQLAPNELQAGVECLEVQSNCLGVDLSDREHEAEKDMQALLTILSSSSKDQAIGGQGDSSGSGMVSRVVEVEVGRGC